jgi:hypothetical protein
MLKTRNNEANVVKRNLPKAILTQKVLNIYIFRPMKAAKTRLGATLTCSRCRYWKAFFGIV